jgi:polysaccharide biosynthesis transport protein
MVESDNTNKNYSDADNSLAIRAESQKFLPSTEVRELVPQLNDEIDLRDYLNTLLRRKTLILSIMATVFVLAALYTFLDTPLFKAKGVVRASAQNQTVTKFENLENNALKSLEFQQTQINLLKSNQLANRVIAKLDLTNHAYFNPQIAAKEGKAPKKSLLAGFASFVRADQEQEQLSVLAEDAQTQLRAHNILNAVKTRLTVSPVRNSEMIVSDYQTPVTTWLKFKSAAMRFEGRSFA